MMNPKRDVAAVEPIEEDAKEAASRNPKKVRHDATTGLPGGASTMIVAKRVTARSVALVTPDRGISEEERKQPEPQTRRRLVFGRVVDEIPIQENVRRCYGVVKRLTGSIGGNASGGAIYGELTMGSMQKVIRIMKEATGLDSSSRFIDVGSGIGKPSIHVAQDPGVDFSFGVEYYPDRWLLSMTCLKGILDLASTEAGHAVSDDERIGYRCFFGCDDICSAQSFNPFTHVYMFSIGFSPTQLHNLSDMWNRSTSSQYLICYHAPKDIIDCYEFHVELITQASTSMHGSKEGHTAYFYRRSSPTFAARSGDELACDPLFSGAWRDVNKGLASLRAQVNSIVTEKMKQGPGTRAASRRNTGV